MKIYIYIILMAVTTYLLRVLPLTVFKLVSVLHPLRLPCRNDIPGDTRSDRVDNQRGGRIQCGVSACLSRKEPCGGCRKQLCGGFCL